MITIVDFNMGNLGSIRNMFKKIGVDHFFSKAGLNDRSFHLQKNFQGYPDLHRSFLSEATRRKICRGLTGLAESSESTRQIELHIACPINL